MKTNPMKTTTKTKHMKISTATYIRVQLFLAVLLAALCVASCQPVPHSQPPETTLSPKDSLILAVLSADTNYSDWLYNIGQASPEEYREALTYKIQAIYGLPDSAKIGVIVGYIKDSLK